MTVTINAVIKRLNRKLAHEGLRLCKTRNPGHCTQRRRDLGAYHVVAGNWLKDKFDDETELQHYARELGVLGSDESIASLEVRP
jgi:hypothetical protein